MSTPSTPSSLARDISPASEADPWIVRAWARLGADLAVALVAALSVVLGGASPVWSAGPAAAAADSSSSMSLAPLASLVPPLVSAGSVSGLPAAPRVAAEEDCLGPDIRCDVADAVKLAPVVAGSVASAAVGEAAGPVAGAAVGGIVDPLGTLGDQVSAAVAQGWTAVMLAVWGAGLYVLKLVLTFADHFLTPDLSSDGPGRAVYAYTFWIAAVLVVVMAMIQLGVAAIRREGKSLARVAIGAAQFVLVWAAWLGYCVVLVAACSGLSRGLMEALLGVSTWSEWDPMAGIETSDITDAVVATVLGLLGLVLWLAALGHLLVMLARAAALLVLVGTGPISAAGLVADAGKAWFWKSLRWFHAAAFTPVVMVLVLGLGAQLATGVAAGLADSSAKAIGTALPAVLLICVSCVAPLSLFKLLAFVDPGTPSGASFRQGMAAQGGIQGVLGGSTAGASGGSSGAGSAASRSGADGRSAGESGAEGSTSDRFSKSTQGALAGVGGAVGGALAAGMGVVSKIGSEGASLMSDQTNQAGVGHHTYGPDFSNIRGSGGGPAGARPHGDPQDGGDGGAGEDSGPDTHDGDPGGWRPPPPAPPRPPPAPSGGGKPAGAGGAGAGAGGGAGSGAGGAGSAAGGAAGGGAPPVPA